MLSPIIGNDGTPLQIGDGTEMTANKGVADGYAPLDSTCKLPSNFMQSVTISSYLGNFADVATALAAPSVAAAVNGDWLTVDTDGGHTYIIITDNPTTEADMHVVATPTDAVQSVAGRAGVVILSKADVGLSNVDNTADLAKPISTATQTALDLKAPLADPALTGVVSITGDLNIVGTNRKITADFSTPGAAKLFIQSNVVNGVTKFCTIPNGTARTSQLVVSNASGVSAYGYMNIAASDTSMLIQTVGQNSPLLPLTFYVGTTKVAQMELDGTTTFFGNITAPNVGGGVSSVNTRTGAVVITKADVGLTNAEDTADLAKPISTATQAAINAKEPLITQGSPDLFWAGDKTWKAAAPAVIDAQVFAQNLIVNGDMYFDQRNAGAVQRLTVGGSTRFPVDRCGAATNISGSIIDVQQKAVTEALPLSLGLTKCVSWLNTLSVAVGSTSSSISWAVEGAEFAKAAFGTPSARPITISFLMSTGLVGTYAVAVRNAAMTRSYVFPITISTVDAYEYKEVVVPGDITGVWETGVLSGITLSVHMGATGSYNATPNTWTAGNKLAITGNAQVCGLAGCEVKFTGVQIVLGNKAPPFAVLPRQIGLALCQRDYEKSFAIDVAPAQNLGLANSFYSTQVAAAATSQKLGMVPFKVPKRVSPTVTLFNPSALNAQVRNATDLMDCSSSLVVVATGSNINGFAMSATMSAAGAPGHALAVHWVAATGN